MTGRELITAHLTGDLQRISKDRQSSRAWRSLSPSFWSTAYIDDVQQCQNRYNSESDLTELNDVRPVESYRHDGDLAVYVLSAWGGERVLSEC